MWGGGLFLVESDTGGPLGLAGLCLFLLQAGTGGADTALCESALWRGCRLGDGNENTREKGSLAVW